MLLDFISSSWLIFAKFAPFLLVGFVIAGILHYIIDPKMVLNQLGRPNLGSIIKAALIGIPLPLCSCSVIPVAASIKKIGANNGSTISFLSSTPQTGIDSIIPTYGLFGGAFTIIKIFVALICGVISGVIINLTSKKDNINVTYNDYIIKKDNSIKKSLVYFFIELPLSLYKPLIFGVIIAAAIDSFLPNFLIPENFSSGFLAFLIITLISIPLYICSLESLPIALSLLSLGLSPGSILVFLIVGPATNSSTILSTLKIVGKKNTIIYLITIIAISWTAGMLMEISNIAIVEIKEHKSSCSELNHMSAILLILYFLFSILSNKLLSKNNNCKCNQKAQT